MRKYFAIIVVVLASLFLPAPTVSAEGNTVTISPASVDIELSQDDSEKVTTFTVTNSYNVPVELTIDLQGIDQQGGRIIPTDQLDPGLVDSVRFSDQLLIIPDNSTKTVSVTFVNSSSLSPGGHYGTIVFAQKKAGDSEVNITQSVSVGLFLVKRGGQIREVKVNTFRLNQLPYQIPSATLTGIENTGNVHITPRASVLVYDWRDNLLAKSIVNEDSRRILPAKELVSETKIVQSRRLWYPQRIKIILEYRGDGIEEIKQLTLSKIYIPAYIFIVIPVLVGSFVFFLRKRKSWRKRSKRSLQTEQSTLEGVRIAVRRIEKSDKPSKSDQKIVVKTNDSDLET